MAHPVRLEALEVLRDEGPLTATELGERLGESPANTSFHLRTLARYGLVEEAGGGVGRARPWRAASGGLLIREEELDGSGKRAAGAVIAGLRAAVFRQIERWAAERAGYPRTWQAAGFELEFRARLTADELADVGRQIDGVLAPYRRPRKAPEGAERVAVAVWGFPSTPPSAPDATRR